MPIIKRYPNRKLYDTEAKRYVTLSEIADLIREGHDVQVIDHTNGQDLTAVTLSQVILEQEKRQRGFLPQTVLTGLIQAGGERLSTLRRTLASPLDLAHHVDEEIEQRIQALISRGEIAVEEGLRLRDRLMDQKSRSRTQDLETLLTEHGVPTQEEFQQLFEQLDDLAAKLETLTAQAKASDS